MMQKIQQTVQSAQGWRARVMMLSAGAAMALALPPFFMLPLLLVAFPAFLWRLSQAQGYKAAFITGWWCGLGFFVVGLYWFSHALLIDPWRFGWLVPFALIGLNGLLAVHIGLIGAAVYALRSRGVKAQAMMLVLCWLVMELLRSVWFTGFPWNLVGYALSFAPEMSQVAAYGGVYLLSLLVMLWALLPVWLQSRRSIYCWSLICLLPCLLWGAGNIRITQLQPVDSPANETLLRLVQPNIAQSLKWDERARADNVGKLVELTVRPGLDKVGLVIWPESSIPYALDAEARWPEMFARFLPENVLLVSGVNDYEQDPLRVWNSMVAFDASGDVVGRYRKRHLVPFGEYVPLRKWLPIDKITPGTMDFSAGEESAILPLRDISSPLALICYEVIFPWLAEQRGAQWMLNITNDGWFGYSSGPYQHFYMSMLRAIEQGKPLVRVSNRGPSTVFSALGEAEKVIGLYEEDVLDIVLPAAVSSGTIYSRYGGVIILLEVCIILSLCVFLCRLSQKKTDNA